MYRPKRKDVINELREVFALHHALEALISIVMLVVVLLLFGFIDITTIVSYKRFIPIDFLILYIGILRLIAIWISMTEYCYGAKAFSTTVQEKRKTIIKEITSHTLYTLYTIVGFLALTIFANLVLVWLL